MRFSSVFSGLFALSALVAPLASALPIDTRDISIQSRPVEEVHSILPRVPAKKTPKPPKTVKTVKTGATAKAAKASKEEFWFRFEDNPPKNEANLLQLTPRNSNKDFDDQAYKFISTDALQVRRTKDNGRTGVVYVLPAGTRDRLLPQRQDFAKTSVAEQAVDFVFKKEEPGDMGIQGTVKDSNGQSQLDHFRSQIIRAFYVADPKVGASQPFFTLEKGVARRSAKPEDQAFLAKLART